MDDLLAEFLTETNENLNTLDNDLVDLEQHPDDIALLSRAFRAIHTIKGSSGFLDLPRLEELAHHAEHILGLFRKGEQEISQGYISLILESLDRVRVILTELEKSGKEPEGDDSPLIDKITKIINTTDADGITGEQKTLITNENANESKEDTLPQTPADISTTSIRINIETLENLMAITGELVLTRNRLLQEGSNQASLSSSLQDLNQLIFELQDNVIKTRMQPIHTVWDSFPRIIRDLGLSLGKDVTLSMTGQETELDRQILETIKAPLTHIIRNAVDHGIEPPAERLKLCKKSNGSIKLNARHEGGHIIIEISDDGRGLPTKKIGQKAIQNKLITKEEQEAMPEEKIWPLIFEPGLSTSTATTAISGRGVGMDVVKSNIDRLGGSVTVQSRKGHGTTFTIRIPITLTIVPSLIIKSATQYFALPQTTIGELVMASDRNIDTIKNTPVLRLRKEFIPIIELDQLFGLSPVHTKKKKRNYNGKPIIVVRLNGHVFGLVVETIIDTEEIVIKPLAKILKNLDVFLGCTILGDGNIAMVLDPSRIASFFQTAQTENQPSSSLPEEKKEEETPPAYLLFKTGKGAPKGIDIAEISHLRKLSPSEIEWSGELPAFQDQGEVLPLILYNNCQKPSKEGDSKPVIILEAADGKAGILVDHIIDIHTGKARMQTKRKNGLTGSTIIKGKATDIINAAHINGTPL